MLFVGAPVVLSRRSGSRQPFWVGFDEALHPNLSKVFQQAQRDVREGCVLCGRLARSCERLELLFARLGQPWALMLSFFSAQVHGTVFSVEELSV